MTHHIRIAACIADPADAALVEQTFTSRCSDCIIRLEPDPERFLVVLSRTAADIVIVDATSPRLELETYLPKLQHELVGKPLLMLATADHEPRRLHCSQSGYVEVIPKDTGFAEELPRAVARLIHKPAPAIVPRNRSAEILSARGDYVDQTISSLEDEINNPLMTIFGTVELLLQSPDQIPEDSRRKLRVIQKSARRIQKTLQKISSLAREHS